MSDKITNSPQIRFAGFTDTWEQRKAEEIFKTVSDKGHPELPVLSASQQLGMVRRDENGIDIQYDKKSVVNYKRVLPKQFVIHLRSFQGGFAHSNLEGITSPAYTIIDFKSENNHSDLFWNEIFTSKKFIKNLETVTYGIRDGRSISFNDFKTLLFTLPSYKEQEQIAGFFNDLNNLITLHQRELELLKDTKKSLLQKMFPKDGANVPEIRFEGFTAAWEQRKLGESVNFLNGRAYKQTELLDSGKYRVLRVGNFNTNDRWYFSDLELEENKYANNGDLLYLWATNFGPEIWRGEKVVYHYHIWKLDIMSNNLDKQYLYTWLENDKERIKQNTNGTTMVHVTKGNMEDREFQVPVNLEEQQKIGAFFKQIDETITLHQRELNLLKNLKKSLFQKMFI